MRAGACRYSERMLRQRRHPAATLRTTRLEAFTDGVFAIAATLLVLDLTTHSLGKVTSDAQMWAALGGMWELFANFVVSFILLCLLWMVHVQQFEHVQHVDGTTIWFNNLRLLFIVLVPFATSLTTEYSEFLAARLSMPIAFFFSILFGWLQWQWTMRRRAELMPELSAEEARDYGRAALSALIIAAVVVVLAPWIGSAAFFLFAADGLLTRVLVGRPRAGAPDAARADEGPSARA